jgi:hypothetical protein
MAALVANINPLPDVEENSPNYKSRKKSWKSRLQIKKGIRSAEKKPPKIGQY